MSVVVAGANCNDHKLARQTLEQRELSPPKSEASRQQHLCLDKGYNYPEVDALAEEFHFTLHRPAQGEEARTVKRRAGTKARRWVVERTHSWLNRFRAILIRWNKKADNYLAMLHLALGIITWRMIYLLR